MSRFIATSATAHAASSDVTGSYTRNDGEPDARFHIKAVVLEKEDIQEHFDGGYHRFMQGAILHKGRIYTAEGFDNDPIHRPAIRIVDLSDKRETYLDLLEIGMEHEPELIDFYNGICLYSDYPGNLYAVEF